MSYLLQHVENFPTLSNEQRLERVSRSACVSSPSTKIIAIIRANAPANIRMVFMGGEQQRGCFWGKQTKANNQKSGKSIVISNRSFIEHHVPQKQVLFHSVLLETLKCVCRNGDEENDRFLRRVCVINSSKQCGLLNKSVTLKHSCVNVIVCCFDQSQ